MQLKSLIRLIIVGKRTGDRIWFQKGFDLSKLFKQLPGAGWSQTYCKKAQQDLENSLGTEVPEDAGC